MASHTAASKGKGKEKDIQTASTSSGQSAAASAPVIGGSRGDWTAVWSAERNAYYFWNKQTGVTTWENPFENEGSGNTDTKEAEASTSSEQNGDQSKGEDTGSAVEPAASAKETPEEPAEASSSNPSGPAIASSNEQPATEDYGGIDPELAYLDPTLAYRKSGAAGAKYAARFNARTGRFEGDPNRNPDHVSDVQRAKRQNQFYFDYGNWEKTLAAQQEDKARKRAAGELDDGDDGSRKRQPTKKEMAAIRERNKEKKEKKQKGWLLG